MTLCARCAQEIPRRRPTKLGHHYCQRPECRRAKYDEDRLRSLAARGRVPVAAIVAHQAMVAARTGLPVVRLGHVPGDNDPRRSSR